MVSVLARFVFLCMRLEAGGKNEFVFSRSAFTKYGLKQRSTTDAIEELVQHKLYKKAVKRTVKFKAHDENGEAHVGDKVSIMETRPLSKEKRWRLVQIVEKAK